MGVAVIDAFVATLGLDGTLFNRGMADSTKSQKKLDEQLRRGDTDRERREKAAAAARKKRQKDEEDGHKRQERAVNAVRNQLLGMAALFTAGMGIKGFIENTINSAANLGYLSANLRMSTEDLTAWQRASERAGGSAEGIIGQFKESADTLAQLRSGLGPNEGLQNFFRFGGNSDDLKDGNTYLLARSRIVADMFKVDPAKAALISKSMGISDDQFNFLKQGPAAVLALVHAQEKNSAIAAKDAAAALELKNKMLDLRDSLQATTVKILTVLLPSLNRLGDWILSMTAYITDNKDVIAGWVESFVNADWSKTLSDARGFATEVSNITKNVRELLDWWARWTDKDHKIPTDIKGISEVIGRNTLDKKAVENANADKAKPIKPGSIDDYFPNFKGMMKELGARTLASFGSVSAKEYIRDTTGKDDYNIGPKYVEPKPQNAKYIMDKLRAQGWSAEQSAGIVGSLQQESGLNPNARNPKSGAYGIAQWLSKDRIAEFKRVMGRDLVGSTLDQQLEFQNYELTRGNEKNVGKKLKAAGTAEEAARIHSKEYERPGEAEANVERRQRLAAQLAAPQRAANAAAATAMPSGAPASAPPTRGNTSTSTSTTTVENVNVYTQATDAKGIAKDMRPAIEKYTFSTQANTGMR